VYLSITTFRRGKTVVYTSLTYVTWHNDLSGKVTDSFLEIYMQASGHRNLTLKTPLNLSFRIESHRHSISSIYISSSVLSTWKTCGTLNTTKSHFTKLEVFKCNTEVGAQQSNVWTVIWLQIWLTSLELSARFNLTVFSFFICFQSRSFVWKDFLFSHNDSIKSFFPYTPNSHRSKEREIKYSYCM
jgi:hypothetical protein